MPTQEALAVSHPSASGVGQHTEQRDRLNRRAQGMKQSRAEFDEFFRELQHFFNPRRGRFQTDPNNRGKKSASDQILNSRGRLALRTLASGMHSGITSPARPWFRLLPPDAGLVRRRSVKIFLDGCERAMRQAIAQSGAYNALHTGYGDLGLYGTDAAIIDEDRDTVFVLQQFVPGTFWVASNARGEVDALYVEDTLTVEQIVARFVYRGNPTYEPDWSVCSRAVKNLWDKGNRFERVAVGRMVAPRILRDPFSLSQNNKAIQSAWWEIGNDADRLLRDSGYDRNPIISSRWLRDGYQDWGTSPAMDTLAEVKMLQVSERDKNEAVRRMNRPPVNAPTSMRNTPFSTAPGAINFTDDPNGMRPAFEVNPPIQHMRDDIAYIEDRINEGMYADLFLMLANSDRRQITAREIEERHSEKLIGLGPVLELQHREKLLPLIRGVYNAMTRARKLPEVPAELDGMTLTVDYTSTMAQAMKAVGTGAVERLFGFAGNLAAVFPGMTEKLDGDAAVDEYADMLGVPANIVRDTESLQPERQQKAQEAQAMQAAEVINKAGPAAADAAKVLSGAADPRGPSPRDVLNRIGVGSM